MNKEKYQLVLNELDRKDFKSLIILEIGALGHSLPQTHSDLKSGLHCLTKKILHMCDQTGKLFITCSQSIFQAKTEVA